MLTTFHLNDSFLIQVNFHPTRNNSILDLVLTTVPDLISDIYSFQDIVDSDHYCVSFKVHFAPTTSRPVSKEVFNYKNVNFKELRETLSFVPWHVVMLDDNLDNTVSNWEDLFWAAVNDFIPRRTVPVKRSPPWIDADVKTLCRKKDVASCKALRTKYQLHINKFKSLRRDVKKLIRTKYNAYIKKLADNVATDPKKFWNFYSCKTKAHKLPPAIKRDITDPVPATNPIDRANLFNDYFHSVFNLKDDLPPPPGCHAIFPVSECLSKITMSESEILTTLRSLNPSKSSGPDGIPSRLLKELAPEISSSITCIFNKSLYEGSFPSKWKDCNLTPVFKADQKDIVSNYHGIALLWILSKVLERHVHTRLYHHVSDFLNVNQHRFRQHQSCVTQLLQFVHSTAKSLDAGIQTDVIYVDMAKAFDKVPHEKLLYKLEMVGVRGQLLAWFRSYLTNRHQNCHRGVCF